ncbi:hypothetical protein CBR_g19453 [Chara braunii]|uniref:Uncharacterized protein n=1 Tax=Chara braunii TaxID=69332 RepID=A0A388KXZ9_CHABU|nr:hypothetical protein CBR_g19453 [Chara braunii]|eukprot:GBG74939.1 hypothetical protein CBR_g19453 [Chara braunii]
MFSSRCGLGESLKLRPPFGICEAGNVESDLGLASCIRVHVIGQPRLLNLRKTCHVTNLRLDARVHARMSARWSLSSADSRDSIEVCLHGNDTLERGDCPGVWRKVSDGEWSSVISPFENKFLDIKIQGFGTDAGELTVHLTEEFHVFRLVFLCCGMAMLLLSPMMSRSVPLYYGTAMSLSVFVVVLIVAYQVMRFLPLGRRKAFNAFVFGSVVGFGSVILRWVGDFLTTVLKQFGFGDDVTPPALVLVGVLIFLSGAALGFWFVRRFILTPEGQLDLSTAEFVNWSIRFVACILLYMSSNDRILRFVILSTGVIAIIWQQRLKELRRRRKRRRQGHGIQSPPPKNNVLHSDGKQWSPGGGVGYASSPSPGMDSLHRRAQGQQTPYSAAAKTPSSVTPSGRVKTTTTPASRPLWEVRTYPSVIHTPSRGRRNLTVEEYEHTAQECTRVQLASLFDKTDFKKWMLDNCNRVEITPTTPREQRTDEAIERTADMDENWDGEEEDGEVPGDGTFEMEREQRFSARGEEREQRFSSREEFRREELIQRRIQESKF